MKLAEGRPARLSERMAASVGRCYPLKSGCGRIATSALSYRMLRETDGPVWGRVWGHPILVPTNDLVGRACFLVGDLDPKVSTVLRRYIRRGETVLDIGANIGLLTLLMATLVGSTGQVHAFEPSPVVLPFLRATLAANPALPVVLHERALGDRATTMTLNVPPLNAGAASLVAGKARPGSVPHRVEVRPFTDLLSPEAIARITVVKIDVEGFEHAVLSSVFANADSFRPRLIQFEDAGAADSPIKELLRGQAYRLYGLPRAAFRVTMVDQAHSSFATCNDYVALLDS